MKCKAAQYPVYIVYYLLRLVWSVLCLNRFKRQNGSINYNKIVDVFIREKQSVKALVEAKRARYYLCLQPIPGGHGRHNLNERERGILNIHETWQKRNERPGFIACRDEYYKVLTRAVMQSGLKENVADCHNAFENLPEFFFDQCHCSNYGQDSIAEFIAQKVIEEQS